MDLFSVETIKELMARYNSKPSKIMGQNFLVNKEILNKIIEASNLSKNDTVLEVGPGIGTLTQELAKNVKKVIAVEKDKNMVEILKETLKDYKNIDIIHGDALQTTNYSLPTDYKVVANLPYYITSPIIRMFLETENKPAEMIFMVQKEVAQRICAEPPSPPTNFGHKKFKSTTEASNPKLVGGKMSILAVSVQFYAKAQIISYVSKNCFWPTPGVDSAIIKIVPFGWAHSDFASREASKRYSDAFFKIVKAGFSHPRKQLANNFSVAFNKSREEITVWLAKNNIEPSQRAETLTIQDWINLLSNLD